MYCSQAGKRDPPRGRRGFGPLIAAARWCVALPDYIEQMDDDAVCMALIETKAGVDNIESICRVEGVDSTDAIY